MYKQTNTICKPKRIRPFALIINCTILMKTNSRFSQNVYTISDRILCNKHLRHTTTENTKAMGKVDTSDLMMIITRAIDISFQSSYLNGPVKHMQPHIFCHPCSHIIHYNDVTMGAITSQITSRAIVYSIVYSSWDQRKHQSSKSMAFVRGIHRDRWIPRTNGQ